MPDATETEAIVGVEPSIYVKLLDVKENPERIKLFEGKELVKGANNYIALNHDNFSRLSGFHIDVKHPYAQIQSSVAQDGVVKTSAAQSQNLPGQSPGQ